MLLYLSLGFVTNSFGKDLSWNSFYSKNLYVLEEFLVDPNNLSIISKNS